MSTFSDIEYLVSKWIGSSSPSYWGAENKTEAWDDEIDDFINEVASEIEGDLEPMVETWLDNHVWDRINNWVSSLPDDEEEDED